jgi:hypothetical protein
VRAVFFAVVIATPGAFLAWAGIKLPIQSARDINFIKMHCQFLCDASASLFDGIAGSLFVPYQSNLVLAIRFQIAVELHVTGRC